MVGRRPRSSYLRRQLRHQTSRSLGGTLEETRVKVEDVTGVSLTTGRTMEKEGHLTVGDGLLRQIIIDDQGWEE